MSAPEFGILPSGHGERSRKRLYDLLVVDVDDGQAGLDQLASLTAEIQEEWAKRPGREHVEEGLPEDFKDGVPLPLPPTMTIATPSGGLQLVYVTDHEPDSPVIIGHRLASSLELKAASREGAPISGRLPPTFQKAPGVKPAGAYRFKDSRLPTIIPWPWKDRWLETSMSIRGRMTSIGDNAPPSVADDYAKAEAAKMLKRACDQIAATRVGRRMTINNWSLVVGHLAWALHVPQALHALKVAARKSGWRGDIEKTVEDAFHDGAKEPRDVRRGTFGRRRLKGPDDPLIEFGARL